MENEVLTSLLTASKKTVPPLTHENPALTSVMIIL